MASHQLQVAKCTVELVLGDITCIAVDAIVNAANSSLAGGGGVDGAIHRAGGPSIMRDLQQYDGCPTGSAVITGAGRLPAKFVIHAVGPVYCGGRQGEPELLASCYTAALRLADEHKCVSISFPGISTGIYGYPVADAAKVALSAIIDGLAAESLIHTVKLVQFNEASYAVYKELIDNFPARAASRQTS